MVGNLPTAVCIGPKFVEPKCNIQSIAQYSTYMYNHIILGEATVFEWNSSTWIWQRGLPSLYASDSCQHLSLNCFMRYSVLGRSFWLHLDHTRASLYCYTIWLKRMLCHQSAEVRDLSVKAVYLISFLPQA